ncbi:MAG: glucosaminidase domain-containing protein [Bacteroidales bacterium]|nr:glucosaminidase domain-containing protein [Bacteroidales bacterium]MBQ7819650.1 glucosaminidase domain-containing protein [Bacteroidales bacterium]
MNFISIFKQISYYILFFAIIVITASIPEDIDAQSQNKTYLIYIDKFKDEAMRQQKRYKIPASITLAQGLLESGAGNGELARKSNNHFGIKCHGVWQGEKVYYDDDEKGECFRKYDDPMQSYEDHSLFLTSRPRYAELFNLKITDYRGWAVGLKKCGYATDKAYASKLIGIIELYNLNRYDLQALKKGKKNQEDINPHTPYISWGLLYIEAKEGDTFESISNEFGIKRRKLAKYNELLKDHTFKEGEIIYLQEKNKYSKKGYKYHIVKEGESLHSIAQKYGMKLSNIYALNRKYNNWIPNVGDKIQLNRRRK